MLSVNVVYKYLLPIIHMFQMQLEKAELVRISKSCTRFTLSWQIVGKGKFCKFY